MTRQLGQRRRGVILLIVISLLLLFCGIGLVFVLYAQSQATTARLFREAQDLRQPDADPEMLLSYFLGQLIYGGGSMNGVPTTWPKTSTARSLAARSRASPTTRTPAPSPTPIPTPTTCTWPPSRPGPSRSCTPYWPQRSGQPHQLPGDRRRRPGAVVLPAQPARPAPGQLATAQLRSRRRRREEPGPVAGRSGLQVRPEAGTAEVRQQRQRLARPRLPHHDPHPARRITPRRCQESPVRRAVRGADHRPGQQDQCQRAWQRAVPQ